MGMPGLYTIKRVIAAADKDVAELLHVPERSIKGVPMLENLDNGDYVMCVCTSFGKGPNMQPMHPLIA